MNGLSIFIGRLYLLAGVAVWLVSCGGGGGGDDGPASKATIIGTVSGTTIVAFDTNDNQIVSVEATGTGVKSFSLSVPVGDVYKFIFIEDENTATEQVFPLYVGSVNLFSIDSETTIDLGFVDTANDVAAPTYNPLDIDGVSSGGEDPTMPFSLGFAGTYSLVTEYDDNINNGVVINERRDQVGKLSRQDDSHYRFVLSDSGSGAYTIPLERSGQVARIVSSPLDVGDGYLLEFMVLSDSVNMVALMIGQEYSDPTDISFTLSNWVRDSVVVTADDFVGTWSATIHENAPDSTIFSESSLMFTITKVDADTVTVNFRGDQLTLDIVDGRAKLVSAPVSSGSIMYHCFSVRADGEGLSFYKVETALDTLRDLSVGLGLAVKP